MTLWLTELQPAAITYAPPQSSEIKKLMKHMLGTVLIIRSFHPLRWHVPVSLEHKLILGNHTPALSVEHGRMRCTYFIAGPCS